MNFLEFIQPAVPGLKDTLVDSNAIEWFQTDRDGLAHIKVLAAEPDGSWVVLYRFKKGYVAPRHKHLGGIHTFIIDGTLQVRDAVLKTGDYLWEPNGIIHDETRALEDTYYINIADGPLIFFDDSGFRYYAGWEQMLKIKQKVEARARERQHSGA